ncbi:MAG: sigma-70 family RNA polymerase sigma factor [Pseudomonadota bacterium]
MLQNLRLVSSDDKSGPRHALSMPALEALVTAVGAGDGAALEQLYHETLGRVYGLVDRILANASDSEEIVEDVYLYVWRNASTFDPEKGNVMAWLCTIARSRAIDRLRFRQRQHRVSEVLEAEPELREDTHDPLRLLDQTRVQACVAALPATQKQILSLVYFQGLTQAEIAERLDMSLGTVKTHVRRTLIALRNALEA